MKGQRRLALARPTLPTGHIREACWRIGRRRNDGHVARGRPELGGLCEFRKPPRTLRMGRSILVVGYREVPWDGAQPLLGSRGRDLWADDSRGSERQT